MAAPEISARSSRRTTKAGTTINASPVGVSRQAVSLSRRLIMFGGESQAAPANRLPHESFGLVLCSCDSVHNCWELLAILVCILDRSEVKCQLVDFAGELEWAIIVILDERHRSAGVLPDVEILVFWEH